MKLIQFICCIIILCGCDSCGFFYDSKLETPDCCGKGYNLTALGSLVYGPWEIDRDARNEKMYFNEQELCSIKANYSAIREKLVFQLFQDGHVNYWLDSYDFLTLQKPTLVREPKGYERGKVFKNGRWEVNFKDSTLTIDFGKSPFELSSLKGKYVDLGSSYMAIRETTYFDSLYEGEMVKLKRVITTGYGHPWIHQ
jgi:hypothetical protein